MDYSTESIEDLSWRLEEVKNKLFTLQDKIALESKSGADCTEEDTIQLKNLRTDCRNIVNTIEYIFASTGKEKLEKETDMICVFARGDIDADHSDIMEEYIAEAGQAGLSPERHVKFITKTYKYCSQNQVDIGFVLISKPLQTYLDTLEDTFL
ncbi:hypothetical protein [Nostoc sp. LEGE 12450]|uniref:hypothetical protein n=1 Tax=Nostoc sp. LEGE 12450 TaxID=1828643 RepID=UPI001880CA1E|nr:hypothetical protein [Nostoc sp. LEGE 12450]MBE8992652.1 hypothetical protein [Nostoc sp. LEGE 12450]